MKKKLLSGLSLAPVLAISNLAFVSCGHKPEYDEFTQTLYQESYKQFINYIETCPHISNQKVVVIDSEEDSLKNARAHLKELVQQYIGVVPTTDEGGNIYYDIPASKGFENYKKVILQAHMDMVWNVSEDWSGEVGKVISQEKTVDGKTIVHSKDNKTTLGADDGQGVGIILGITKTSNDFNHGPIRCILTTDEDSTIYGAAHLNPDALNADYLVNVDTATQDIVIASSGTKGFRTYINDLKSYDVPVNYKLYSLKILGCKAGHSAYNMVDGKGNPTNVAINILKQIQDTKDSQILLQSIDDKGQTNVLASESEVVFACDKSIEQKDIQDLFKKEKNTFFAEKDMSFVFNEISDPVVNKVISNDDSTKLMVFLSTLSWGLVDKDVETKQTIASANISPVTLSLSGDNFSFYASNLTRFATKIWKQNFEAKFEEAKKKLNGGDFSPRFTDDEESFPIWETNETNSLIQIAQQAYKNININAQVKKEVAALETAYFAEQNPNLQMISIGAIVNNEHNINETMDLGSYYDLASIILTILRNC